MFTREQIERYTQEGAQAFLNGMRPEHAPYKPYTDEFAMWMRGFSNARFGARMSLNPRQSATSWSDA